MWDKVIDWILENSASELFTLLLTTAMALIVGVLSAQLTIWRSMRRLRAGDQSESLIVQLNTVVRQNGAPTLLLRNLAGGGSLAEVLKGNPAVQALVRKAANGTTVSEPLLDFNSEEGQQALHTLVNHVIEASATANFPLRKMLVTVTCEDKRFLRRVQIRIFVMDALELLKFRDPHYCIKVRVEKFWQSIRLIALYLWARKYYNQVSQGAGIPSADQKPATWTIELPIRDDYQAIASLPVDWNSGLQREALTAANLDGEFPLAESQTAEAE